MSIFHDPFQDLFDAHLPGASWKAGGADGPGAEAHVGEWTDEDGVRHRGAKAAAHLFGAKRESEFRGNSWGLEVEGPAVEAGMEAAEDGGTVHAGGKHGTQLGAPGPEAKLQLFKEQLGFASHDKESDHDRGYKFGFDIGKDFGGGEEDGLPIQFGKSDKDGDGDPEYHLGTRLEVLPGVHFNAEYQTETPKGDVASNMLMGPVGMPVNLAFQMAGFGDYAPGTLVSHAGSAIEHAIFGGDDEPQACDDATLDEAMRRGKSPWAAAELGREESTAQFHDWFEHLGHSEGKLGEDAFRKKWLAEHLGPSKQELAGASALGTTMGTMAKVNADVFAAIAKAQGAKAPASKPPAAKAPAAKAPQAAKKAAPKPKHHAAAKPRHENQPRPAQAHPHAHYAD